jgi:prepilin-type N-terminal cleavage/methylation domain-containing protein
MRAAWEDEMPIDFTIARGSGGFLSVAAGRQAKRGFTLIELLAVIAILSLLMTILIPALTKARSIAQRAVCSVNYKNVALGGMSFASAHSGRGPGRALRTQPDRSDYSWGDILNQEFYKAGTIQRYGPRPVKGRIYCPSMTPSVVSGPYPCGMTWNLDALGGPNWGDGVPYEGQYGKALDPGRVTYMYAPYVLAQYSLGAMLERFPRPGQQFLMVEGEQSNDTVFGTGSFGAQVPLPGAPPWCSADNNRTYAFRHVLPRDVSLYQTQATAIFPFLDGHVEVLGPMAQINTSSRFNIDSR